ncbi:hypothetical protein ACA910_019130 [Epithemia clementina (nom. ined.)]
MLQLSMITKVESFRSTNQTTAAAKSGIFRYNICNGLSDQLLHHAASISRAVREKYVRVEIPDYFIIITAQDDLATGDVYPSRNNSIPFGVVFDAPYFLASLRENYGIRAQLVSFLSHKSSSSNPQQEMLKCEGIGSIDSEPPDVVQSIIDLFRPSQQYMQSFVDSIVTGMQSEGDESSHKVSAKTRDIGVCLYHNANDKDWRGHCAKQSSIKGDFYQGNCANEPGQSLLQSIQSRLLHPERSRVYYCGDHDIPSALLDSSTNNFTITSLRKMVDLSSDAKSHAIGENLKQQLQHALPSHVFTNASMMPSATEFWALLDFFVCKQLSIFIGNSISKFSAIQIAFLRYIRDKKHDDGQQQRAAYWYNSQSIPLQKHWRVFQVPIVYTYTEMSAVAGKHMLQTSIESVRSHMPNNPVHVLYHGHEDTQFQQWLESRGVIIHDHSHPPWQAKIEEMRKNGNPRKSHLFLHPGNYFGTWQRIDIPLYLESEYALLLDADTIIRRPFTLTDFGLNLTYALAMSTEDNIGMKIPINAGVTLMNIPHLRRSHSQFLDFILDHVQNGGEFTHPSPSDQGAYMEFYGPNVRFLSHYFNMKPYWHVSDIKPSYIIHFHGPKPKEYIEAIMAKPITTKSLEFLTNRGSNPASILCHALSAFALNSLSVNRTFYCQASFESPAEVAFCQQLFEHLASPVMRPASLTSSTSRVSLIMTPNSQRHNCTNFNLVIQEALESVPLELKLPRQKILLRVGLSLKEKPRDDRVLSFALRHLYHVVFVSGFLTCLLCSRWIPNGRERPQLKRCRKTELVVNLIILAFGLSVVYSFIVQLPLPELESSA